MARIDDIYFASREYFISDPDRTPKDLWARPEPIVEPSSFVVANQVASIQACVAGRTKDCRASEGCRDQGLCVAEDGECVLGPPGIRKPKH